jgi:hypothetical protein
MTVSASQIEEMAFKLRAYDDDEEGAREALAKMAEWYAVNSQPTSRSAAYAYPRVGDPNFHRKLQRMRDFYTTPLTSGAKRRHGLMQHQKFVKAFMSPGTGYNGVLMLHDVGTGKTCTAVSVAEMYRPLMMKPAIVLCPSVVKQQWKDEIANVSKAAFVAGKWVLAAACSNRQYAKLAGRVATDSRVALETTVARAVRANYEFFGYLEFANIVEGNTSIQTTFSDRVLIIDEAHHLRANDTSDKNVYKAVMDVVRMCSNVKVLLLTATPMYDRAAEIVPLINLLRTNDGRAEIATKDHFDNEGRFIAKEAFGQAVSGYVSFVRGESPFTFPSKIPVDQVLGERSAWPKYDHTGRPVREPENCHVLVSVQASALQEERMQAAMSNGVVSDSGEEPGKHTYMQTSSIAYPEDGSVDEGFSACFKGSVQAGHMEYREPFVGLLGQDVGRTAPKIARIADLLDNCRGVAMVYSFWITAGVLPMAIALEERGYVRVNGPPLLKTTARPNGKTYALLTSSPTITEPSSRKIILDKMVSPKNVDGSLITVLLVTNTISEGVNLKHVREAHIMEPWWNMGRSEQIVGRVARYMSHAALHPKRRNLTVYHHVCHLSGDREGIDHMCIRTAMDKRAQIAKVLITLRSEAVDCAFNAKKLQTPLQEATLIETSQGRELEWRVGDHDFSKACLYEKCVSSEKICKANFLTPLASTRTQLFEPLADDVDIVLAFVEDTFAHDDAPEVLTLSRLQQESSLPSDVLMYGLTDIIENETRLDVHGVPGTLRQVGDVYVFVPLKQRDMLRMIGDDVGEQPVVVATLQGDDATTTDASHPISVQEDIATFIVDAPEQEGLRAAALDAVIDRASFLQLRELAVSKDEEVLDSMRRGGFLHENVVVKDGEAYDTEMEVVVTYPSTPSPESHEHIAYLSEGHLYINTSSRGSACRHMHRSKLHSMLEGSGLLVRPDAAQYSKDELCRLLEISLRMQDKVQRPGKTALRASE